MAINTPTERATFDGVHFDLGQWAQDGLLATREQGERARSELQWLLNTHRSNAEPVGIELGCIEAMSFPFADSFFGPLLSGWLTGYYDEHPIVLLGATGPVAETIHAALTLRNLGIVLRSDGDAELLGGEPVLRETIDAASRLGPTFSAKQLGIELGVTPQAINNRLKTLVKMGALMRVPVTVPGGGREFAYQLSGSPDSIV